MRVVLVADFSTNILSNKSSRTLWIKNQTEKALAGYADGINIDFEAPIPKGSKEVVLMTELVNETATAFRQVIKNAQVSFHELQNDAVYVKSH